MLVRDEAVHRHRAVHDHLAHGALLCFEPDRSPEQVIAGYRTAIADSDAHLIAAAGFDVLTAQPVGDAPRTLRWVLAHMTSETIRHAGHADILRELIDGATGR
ncbi:DUF664 domain-containing protein [Micromonospora orduensis]|uniref:DUF664 domain-containing protein n=1 Tax=Micromonospora orduensis TaxID=1420891 RepID=A0A5C4QVB8_9ACTN|nr:DUF664 domain-containing protein [Micromonospora orduensis]